MLKTIGILMQMLPEPVKKVLENRAVQGVMKVTGGVSEIATGCGLCTTAVGCIQGIPLIIFGTNMAFEGIQDLWYTLKGELDHESKNLIKEATGHKVDNLVELAEIGMSIYSGKVASKKIVGKLGEESEKLSGLLKKTRKPMPLVSRTKRLVKKFMPKKRYRKFKVVDIEELAERQCLKPNIQLFAEEKNIWDSKSYISPQQMNKLESLVREGKDIKFKSKSQALEFIKKKFGDFKEEKAGNRSSEGWHFDKHCIKGSANPIEHINLYSKKLNFRVHITWE
ncbi:MAG: hypothetical protein Q4B93_05520 [Clostridia bacterium]|nr:hypothetical protein [Clostridia bacterium]